MSLTNSELGLNILILQARLLRLRKAKVILSGAKCPDFFHHITLPLK